jgi:hypothetical protein
MSSTTTTTIATLGSSAPAVPPPLSVSLIAKSVPEPPNGHANGNGSVAAEVETGALLDQHQQQDSVKKRKRSNSSEGTSKVKKQKLGNESNAKKKKKEKRREKKKQDESDEDEEDDLDEDTLEMNKNELVTFVDSIMNLTNCDHPDSAIVMLGQKLSILDQFKKFFGLESHNEDIKLVELLNDAQLKAIYKGMVMGKLVLPMEEYQADGAPGFIEHILDSKAAGKHLVPYAFCCWDPEKNNIHSSLNTRKRDAAINPSSENFYLFKDNNEFKKALRRTKFWYAFATELEKGQVEISELTWDDIKKYCEAYWYENEEARGFKKYYINVYADKKPQLQSYPAWPIPKGAWKEQKDFMLGVWPFVQIYFMSPLNGPIVLDHDQQDKASSLKNANKPAFDFAAAVKKRQATTTTVTSDHVVSEKPVEEAMVIDDYDDDDQESAHEKRERKRKSKSKKNKIKKFADSQAEEEGDD